MKVILHTGKKNILGLNGLTLALKEIVDRRVSVIVPQSLLAPADRRGTAATRVVDFVPSDIVEYIGTLEFAPEAAEEAVTADTTAVDEQAPDLFSAVAEEVGTAEESVSASKSSRKGGN